MTEPATREGTGYATSRRSRTGMLIGFDGSEASRVAAAWAAAEAASTGRRLGLVSAFRWPMPELRHLGVHQDSWTETRARERAETQLAEAVRHCRDLAPAVEVDGRLVDGNAVEVLAKFAAAGEPLVLGAVGQSAIGRVLVGSAAAELARRATGSVVIVRDVPEGPPGQAWGASGARVVVGIDGSAGSAEVARVGFDFAARHHHELVAVHAWSDLPSEALTALCEPPVDRQRAIRAARATLDGLLAMARRSYPQVAVRQLVDLDRPARALLAAANGAALLVVGRHGRAGSYETPLGSVSHAMLHYAPCPVALVATTPAG